MSLTFLETKLKDLLELRSQEFGHGLGNVDEALEAGLVVLLLHGLDRHLHHRAKQVSEMLLNAGVLRCFIRLFNVINKVAKFMGLLWLLLLTFIIGKILFIKLIKFLFVDEKVVAGSFHRGKPDLVGRVVQTCQQHLLDDVHVLLLLIEILIIRYEILKKNTIKKIDY